MSESSLEMTKISITQASKIRMLRIPEACTDTEHTAWETWPVVQGRANCNFSNLMGINKDYAKDVIKNSLLHSKLSLCLFKLEEIPSYPVYKLINIYRDTKVVTINMQ